MLCRPRLVSIYAAKLLLMPFSVPSEPGDFHAFFVLCGEVAVMSQVRQPCQNYVPIRPWEETSWREVSRLEGRL